MSPHSHWALHTDSEERHVWPVGDLLEHEVDGLECPCGPSLEVLEEEPFIVMVTHNAIDGRA